MTTEDKKLTIQEMFNGAWKHFIVDKNPRSVGDFFRCKYRGKNGTKCAIGLFIPDEQYDCSMDGLCDTRIGSIIEKFPQLPFAHIDIDILIEFQICHDDDECKDFNLIKIKFEEFAGKYSLTIPN